MWNDAQRNVLLGLEQIITFWDAEKTATIFHQVSRGIQFGPL